MRILSAFAHPIFLVLVLASALPSAAADRQPNWKCRWDGTAPFCDGACKGGESFTGAAYDADQARNVHGAMAAQLFGSDCATGTKAWCCTYSCPKGFRLITLEPGGSTEGKKACREIDQSGDKLTKQTGPEAKRKKAPIEAPSPVEETELNKGPVVAPGPVEGTKVEEGPITAPSEAPAMKRKTGPLTE